MKSKYAHLTGRKKCAILLVSAGSDLASNIYKCLTDEELEQITLEIANVGNIPMELTRQVFEEFHCMTQSQIKCAQGGISIARELLEKSLGGEKAMEIIERLQNMHVSTPFDFLQRVDPEHLFFLIQNEHPQIIALILVHLEKEQSISIFSSLPLDLQTEVALRIATIEAVSSEVISRIERELEKQIFSILYQNHSNLGGIEKMVELLNGLDLSTRRTVIDEIAAEGNTELVEAIKDLSFTFDDLARFDDRTIQLILRKMDVSDLAIALRCTTEEIRKAVFRNISPRKEEIIREESKIIGPVKKSRVEEAQKKITQLIYQMRENREILIPPMEKATGDDENLTLE